MTYTLKVSLDVTRGKKFPLLSILIEGRLKVKVKLNERSSAIVRLLSEKLKVDSDYVLRIAVFELARYMLGCPDEFVIFQKKDWDNMIAEVRNEIDVYWRKHPREAKRKGVKVR